jgi:hypothetical protein
LRARAISPGPLPLGGHTGLGGSFRNHSESFGRASRGFKGRSIAFRKFQSFSPNRELSMAYGRTAAKKSPTAPWGGRGRALPRRTVLGALAHPANRISRLRGLSSSIQILASRRLIYFRGDRSCLVSVPHSRRDACSRVENV